MRHSCPDCDLSKTRGEQVAHENAAFAIEMRDLARELAQALHMARMRFAGTDRTMTLDDWAQIDTALLMAGAAGLLEKP